MAGVEEESINLIPAELSDLDLSFTSTTSSSYATTFASSSSARSSLSLSLPSFSAATALSPLPHARSDPHWSAIRAASNLTPDGCLHLRHLRLLRQIGSGNLARVFHCRLRGFDDDAPGPDFALKVVDLDVAARAGEEGKLAHVRTEARVLAALDHPFLPTLYARLDASHYACFLIDYCPGGDQHSLLRCAPGHRLPVPAARFYAAEVLLALEYLHALGFVYRDLKPENVLLRADGHVMLSDFDLCLQADVEPTLRKRKKRKKIRHRWRYTCWLRGAQTESQEEELEFVAEPEEAYSRACVGTHEYLAPEVVSGSGHRSSVDWWAFGVFVYELIYGRTPFKGGTKEATLRNIAARELRFPDAGPLCLEALARDLIRRLLVRDPKQRLGSAGGATEIKRHPFFDGVKWALIRSCTPPVVAGTVSGAYAKRKGRWLSKWSRSNSSIIVCKKAKKKSGKSLGWFD